jgi:large subunit ribosomal protein L7e
MLLNNVICFCEQEKELVQLKHEARMKGGFYVSPEEKLLFVVRILLDF